MLEINKIHLGNCLDLLREIDSESADICVTSPPYKDEDGYSAFLMFHCFAQIFRILKPNSLFFLNFGHLAEFKSRPFEVCLATTSLEFKLNDTITWIKTQFSPIQGNKRLNNVTEFIFLLYKGNMPNLDRLSIGVEYQDKSNIGRYSDKDLRCGGNVWKFGYETIQSKTQKLHNDRFPLELPRRCIKLSGLKKGLLIEPFCGSGTSCLAAKELGLDYIGIEINKDHYKTACNRLELNSKNSIDNKENILNNKTI